jgi:hypothetical protein
MSYIGSPAAPLATELGANTVETTDIQDSAVTAAKLATTSISDKLGYTPASTGKSIAMAIVFG